jgi:hypothetical protein
MQANITVTFHVRKAGILLCRAAILYYRLHLPFRNTITAVVMLWSIEHFLVFD